MKSIPLFILLGIAVAAHAAEPGFVPLLDRDHADGWVQCGPGKMAIINGVSTNSSPQKWGVAWYSKRMFSDFTFRAEFKGMGPNYNSGIWLRFSAPQGTDIMSIHEQKYEVAIENNTKGVKWPTGSIHGVKTPTIDLLRPHDWNDLEITAIGQQYAIRLNGKIVNEFTGSKNTAGYLGLEENAAGPVQFRNIRIKDLTAATAAASMAPASIQTDASQPRIEVLKDQGLNAEAWALSPLDEDLPGDIRQNIGRLREDLLDEATKNPKGNSAAYKAGAEFCDRILTALDLRELARVNAGYTAAQADADRRTGNAQLNVSRNYMMSWPQYRREESQRAALRQQENSVADVKKERTKVDWANRAVRMRDSLDDLYRQFREALR